MNKKTISILTPVKNAEKFILETCKSIQEQTYSHWEWIVVDDHSNHSIEEFLPMNDNRIEVVMNDGEGIVDALNTGMKHVKGEFITRMDGDDKMPKDKLQLFLETLSSKEVDVVTGRSIYFSDFHISEGYKRYEKWLNGVVEGQQFYEQIYRECTVCSSNWMMKTELFQHIGGFENLCYPEDYDLLFRWYKNQLRIEGVNEVTHLWREHSERTSRNHIHYSQEYFFDLKIRRFVEIDYIDSAVLVLVGTNKKAKLTAAVLYDLQLPFYWISNKPQKYGAGLFGHKILGKVPDTNSKKYQVFNAVMISNSEIITHLGLPSELTQIFWL